MKLSDCPVEMTLKLIRNQWILLIVRDLLTGTKRFSELKRSLGNITPKVLTQNLRFMERNGLVRRKVYAEVPPRVEYSLTEIGFSLKTVTDVMAVWGEQFKTMQQKDQPKTNHPDCTAE